MSTQSLKKMSQLEVRKVTMETLVTLSALANIQEAGDLESCRIILRSLWCSATDDEAPKHIAHTCEMVVAAFFRFDGDMIAAREDFNKRVTDGAPQPVLRDFALTLKIAAARREAVLREVAAKNKEKIEKEKHGV